MERRIVSVAAGPASSSSGHSQPVPESLRRAGADRLLTAGWLVAPPNQLAAAAALFSINAMRSRVIVRSLADGIFETHA
jgi:hypothetical protein